MRPFHVPIMVLAVRLFMGSPIARADGLPVAPGSSQNGMGPARTKIVLHGVGLDAKPGHDAHARPVELRIE